MAKEMEDTKMSMSLDDSVLEVYSEHLRKQSIIWDPEHPEHMKYKQVSVAWQDIMSALQARFSYDELLECDMETIPKIKVKLKVKKDTRNKQRKKMGQRDAFGRRRKHRMRLDPRFNFLDRVLFTPEEQMEFKEVEHVQELVDSQYPPTDDAAMAMLAPDDGAYGDTSYASRGRYHNMYDEPYGMQEEDLSRPGSFGDDKTQAVASVCQAIVDGQKQDEIDHLFEYFKAKFRRCDRADQDVVTDKIMTILRQHVPAAAAAAAATAETTSTATAKDQQDLQTGSTQGHMGNV